MIPNPTECNATRAAANRPDPDNEAWFLAGQWWQLTHPGESYTDSLDSLRQIIAKAQEIKKRLLQCDHAIQKGW